MNKWISCILLFKVLSFSVVTGQEVETLVQTNFAIRDFIVEKDSIIFLKKRDLILKDVRSEHSQSYFLGGYGLEIQDLSDQNTIVTVSNELVNNVSSVRFYNRSKNDFDQVYYNRQGKIIDFLIIPEANLFALSLVSNKIIIIDYSEAPRFLKTIQIDTEVLSRRMQFKDNELYYVTDNGGFFSYNINTYEKKEYFKTNEQINDFVLLEKNIIYSTIEGSLVRRDLLTGDEDNFDLLNNFVTALDYDKDYLVFGTWLGDIFVFDLKNFEMKQNIKAHKKPVLKLFFQEDIIYSSSVDQTIKKSKLSI